MTKEIELQKYVIQAVEIIGKGFGEKLSHKFKTGVPDLWVKAKDYPASFFEVKAAPAPLRPTTPILLDVTPLQARFLRRVAATGQDAGIISFLERGSGLHAQIGVAVIGIEYFDFAEFALPQLAYVWGRKRAPDRNVLIFDQLKRYWMGDRRVG